MGQTSTVGRKVRRSSHRGWLRGGTVAVALWVAGSLGAGPAQAVSLYTITDLGTLPGVSWSRATGINNHGQVVGVAENASGDERAFLWTSGSGMVDLGTLGGDWSLASGINNHGQVVGVAENASGNRRAFLWTSESGMVDLGTLGGDWSLASGINDHGQVVGEAENARGRGRAFLWNSGTMTELGTFGRSWSEAFDINDHGQVVGWAENARGYDRAFLWTSESGMVDLGTLGGDRSRASGINN
ncbi:MAG: hypothetical protein NHB36_11550, partial [Nitrospira sp.]|nr:hypothetical protein [Nitrospira sp.]